MGAGKVLREWDLRTSEDRRREVYERLLESEEFGDFLKILRERQVESWRLAQVNPAEAAFYLGAAEVIDQVVEDIRTLTKPPAPRM